MADAAAEHNVYREAEVPGAPANGNGEGPAAPEAAGNIQEQVEEFLGPHPDYDEEEEERKYYRRKRLGVVKNVVGASVAGMIVYSVYLGLLQMQLILHYDETYREVKYGTLGLEDIDNKMLMGINVTPIIGLLYTPVLIRFLGTKWMMFLASGIYALFVSTNYWERYYTLVPAAVAIGAAIVPLWASLGNYITRMAQQYYEYKNYKEDHVQEQKKPPKGAFLRYIVIFQSVFYIIFHLSFVFAEFPMAFFLNTYLNEPSHILYGVKTCGANSHGIITGLNKTVLQSLPRSLMLIEVESVLMGAAFMAMIIFLVLCGAAYRPTEEIDLRSIGWGNIFQLPFKHLRDYRLRLLIPFFIYSGFEVLFAVNGIILSYGVCSVGLKKLWLLVVVYGLSSSCCSALSLCLLRLPRHVTLLGGAFLQLGVIVGLMCWSPLPLKGTKPDPSDPLPVLLVLTVLWGVGTALNKTGLSSLLGMLYEDKERLDFVFTIYHWFQAIAIFIVYLWSNLPMRAKLAILLITLLLAMFCYWRMERQLAKRVPYRLPRIPRPRHKVKGYRYLEEENSDESDSEQSADGEHSQDDEDGRGTEEEEVAEVGGEGDAASLGSQRSPGPHGRRRHRRRRDDAYEQAGDRDEYA
ncbi:protein unc-93 homolog B1 [Alosa pseudoharengus]|uniref:protein unc-93 homolog B1 n=1 Tax=Alosa pseudoharengus TaxID=34774 RepID=UPI003F8CAD84